MDIFQKDYYCKMWLKPQLWREKRALNYTFASFNEFSYVPINTFFNMSFLLKNINPSTIWIWDIWITIYALCRRLTNQGMKVTLNVNKSWSIDVVMSDMGRFPIHINASKRCIKLWLRKLKLPIHRYTRLRRLCHMLKLYDTFLFYKFGNIS